MYLLHTRFDDAVRTHVEAKFRQAYPAHRVSLQSARRIEGQGIELRGLKISESGPHGAEVQIVHVDEMLLQCNAALEELVAGKLNAKQLVLRRLQLNAVMGQDGQWNFARLLPLPRLGSQQVPIVIENSSAQFATSGSEKPFLVAIQQLKLIPQVSSAVNSGAAPAKDWTFQAVLDGPHMDQLVVAGSYDVASRIWRADGRVQGFKLGPQLAQSLPREFGECTSVLNALHVAAHAKFHATNANAGDSWCRFYVEGEAAGRIDDNRLPFSVAELQARFSSDGRSLSIHELSARAGQATLQGSCEIAGFYEDAPCSLQLTAKQLRVDRQLVAALPSDWREMWGKLAPEGCVDAEAGFSFDGRQVKHYAVVDCHDVSFAYYKFPYRLEYGKGRVEWRDGVLKFDQFQAFASGREVRIDGNVKNPGPEYEGFVEVRVVEPDEFIPIDEKLIAALPDSARRVANQLHPAGALTLWARFERQASNPPVAKKELKLGLQDCSTKYELFPYPLYEIHGVVTMLDDHWELKGLEGVNDTAWVQCNGQWGPDENGVLRLSLNFNGNDVTLEEELCDALRPDAQNVWKSLHPRGTIDDLMATVDFNGLTRKIDVEVTATKRPAAANVPGRTITVMPTWLPYQLEDVEGTFKFHNGVTDLTGVRGRHGGTVMCMDGKVETPADGKWQIHINPLNIDRMELNHELISALPRRLGESLTRLHINGPVNLSGAMVLQGTKGDASPTSTEWDVNVVIENGGLNCGVQLDHIFGGLKLAGIVDPSGLSSHGWLNVDSLIYQGIQFTQVEGPISINDERLGLGEWVTRNEHSLPPRTITARVFGGTMLGNAEITLSGDYPFRLQSRLSNGDLATISREATSRRHNLSGRTFAELHLTGTSKGAHTLRGTGNVQLTDADVYELPVMVRLLKLLRIKPPDETAFTSSDLQYHIEGDRVYFDNIHFDGDAIDLDGSGDMTLDRAINLTFHTSLGSSDLRDFIFRPIFKEAGKQLLEITVTGTLDDPQVNREPLRNIRENIQNILPYPIQPGGPGMSRLPYPVDANNRLMSPR